MNLLLSGVTRGLGLVIARRAIEQGDTVFGLGRSETDDFRRLRDEAGERLRWIPWDLSDLDALPSAVFQDGIGAETPLHGFINNAATAYDDIITNLDSGRLEAMYRVNVFAPMLLTKLSLRHFLLHEVAGAIVHISSVSAHTGYKGLAMYASSKGAIEAFSKTTAREWGERGIRSNCVVAGFMETDMSADLSDEQRQRIYRRTALKSPTSLVSVAATALFLASAEAVSITGQNVFVDSGTI